MDVLQQRINVTFNGKEQALFPGPNRYRQKTPGAARMDGQMG